MGHPTTRPSNRLRPSRARLVLLAVLAARLAAVGPTAAPSGTAQVERVIDSDTIRVRMARALYTVRLIGVDMPETTHPTVGVELFGPEASAYTPARPTGAPVRLGMDPAGDVIDTDGRWLRYVMLPGGEHVNATLIRDGYGEAIRAFPYSRRQAFLGLDAEVRRGIRAVGAAPCVSGMGAA